MKNYWVTSTLALVMMTGGAPAQTAAPEATRSTNGPAGTVETAHTGVVVDGTGAATGSSDTFKKTQSYSSGDGQLSARTSITTTGTPASATK
jgi:hypothetical protein